VSTSIAVLVESHIRQRFADNYVMLTYPTNGYDRTSILFFEKYAIYFSVRVSLNFRSLTMQADFWGFLRRIREEAKTR